MASESAHITCANRTQRTIVHLLADPPTHSPWIATAAFYKALHVVEAVFANDRSVGHTSDHFQRERRLKAIRRYDHISRHYLQLSRISVAARYLSKEDNFDNYLSPKDVENQVLKHYLKQVEQSACKFLKNPSELSGIDSAFTANQ